MSELDGAPTLTDGIPSLVVQRQAVPLVFVERMLGRPPVEGEALTITMRFEVAAASERTCVGNVTATRIEVTP